jgi:hypothetical protein
VFENVNDKVGNLINGMPNEVNIKTMVINDDPYTNDTSKLLRERYSSINSNKNKEKTSSR